MAKKCYLIDVRKPNGMHSYFGKRYQEVFLTHKAVAQEDAIDTWSSRVSCEQVLDVAKIRVEAMGILIDTISVAELTLLD